MRFLTTLIIGIMGILPLTMGFDYLLIQNRYLFGGILLGVGLAVIGTPYYFYDCNNSEEWEGKE